MEEIRSDNRICLNEVVYDGQTEQGVELDYVLPDYYPEIFRIMKCRIVPKILSYSMAGDSKLVFDGCVDIKVLYLAENDKNIHSIDQHYTYSKTVDIGKNIIPPNIAPDIRLLTKPDYCNCRAVSGRRIDVRGAVSTKIRIAVCSEYDIPMTPDNVQVRSENVSCCSKLISTEKLFSVREEIETGAAGIYSIIRNGCVPKINEVRVIADKVIVKGVISVNATYGLIDPEAQGCSAIEQMTADIPVSQIIDVSGIDDSYQCTAELDILSCELDSAANSGIVPCNLQAVCRLSCRKESSLSIITDTFSTEYETTHSTRKIKAVSRCIPISKQLTVRTSMMPECGELEAIYDCSSDIYNLTCTTSDDGTLTLSGLICYQVLGKSTDGIPCFAEKQEGFECQIYSEDIPQKHSVTFNALCTDTDHSLKADGTIELSAFIDFNGMICEIKELHTVENVIVHEDRPKKKQDDYALRIYYADGAEDCWTIAKRYDASVEAIMRENDIQDRDMPISGMVLIPSV